MKFSYLPTFGCLVAGIVLALPSPSPDSNIVVVDDPYCSSSTTHCVYMKNAFVLSNDVQNGQTIKCKSLTSKGRGTGVCEFPEHSTATIKCYKNGGTVTVKFGSHKSSFKKKTKAKVFWSSNHFSGKKVTYEAADDLFVYCRKPKSDSAPVFPPNDDGKNGNAPVFPSNGGGKKNDAPVFPSNNGDSKKDGAPTFPRA